MHAVAVWRSDQLYARACGLYDQSPQQPVIASLFITAYELEPVCTDQLPLYDDDFIRRTKLEIVMNTVNDKYGEQTLMPAAVVRSRNPMQDKIPFGSVRYFS